MNILKYIFNTTKKTIIIIMIQNTLHYKMMKFAICISVQERKRNKMKCGHPIN